MVNLLPTYVYSCLNRAADTDVPVCAEENWVGLVRPVSSWLENKSVTVEKADHIKLLAALTRSPAAK